MLLGSLKPSFRGKVLALAALAVAPWAALAGLAGATALSIGACVLSSAVAIGLLGRLLQPVPRTAAALRALVVAQGADPRGFDDGDDLETIIRGVAHLGGRVQSLQHRWAWQHRLTGLPVREKLVAAIAGDLRHLAGPALLGAIRFADYDRLVAFDPATADEALKRFAERLAASVGKARPVAHVDRDCFAIWFGASEPAAAAVELEALCYALGAEIAAGEMTVVPEIEIATALHPADAADPVSLINHALVSFARPGADRAALPAPGKSAHVARERFALEQDLRHAIERDQLKMVFQPVVHVARGVIGAEALLRWHHPEAGLVSPALFIPILEDADLIDEIGRWTLNVACREMRRWQQRGLKGLKVAVNLSAAQLRDPNLKQTVQRTLERHRLGAGTLELELTETAAAADAERTRALFGELRGLGVSIAIDDFGVGYSSLSYLKNLPFDKLKIDREFVADVHLHADSQAICRSLIALARGLGIEILAEGVERWDEVEMLRGFGCGTFQGYLFSKPVDSDQFIEILLDPKWRMPIRAPLPEAEGETKRMSA